MRRQLHDAYARGGGGSVAGGRVERAARRGLLSTAGVAATSRAASVARRQLERARVPATAMPPPPGEYRFATDQLITGLSRANS